MSAWKSRDQVVQTVKQTYTDNLVILQLYMELLYPFLLTEDNSVKKRYVQCTLYTTVYTVQ